ncbi:unnamed protein product [Nezara viridula]|uniref:Uncharacterized protein n=1 Tax=Nezara viridula TaxID=85310 RepID=A0A9P0HPP0_NEZVI|nr:unnamed protein product [Nezara viridula]
MNALFFILTIYLLISIVNSVNCPHYCQCLVSKHLRHVQCIGKGLISVDLNIPHSVQWLQLSNNLIYELDDNIFETLGLKQIVELYLDKNAIQALGLNAFSGLKKLKTVDLSDNRLHSIPSGVFQQIPSLINVFLHGNPLKYLRTTEPFLNSSSIQILDLSYCRISHIPVLALSALHSLIKLNISSNLMENIDYFSYKDLIYLEEIDLSNNKLSCDYKSKEFLTWTSAKTIKVFGSVCEMVTTSPTKVKTLEKIIMYESENTVPEKEDISVNFDSECTCSTCDSKYQRKTVNSESEITRSNENQYLSLFLVLSFMSGLVVGIAVTVFLWIFYHLIRFRERHHLCYTSMNNDDPLQLFEDLYSN